MDICMTTLPPSLCHTVSVLLAPCELQCLSSHRASVSCSSLCFLLALSDDDDGGGRQAEPGTAGGWAGRQQQAAMLNLKQRERERLGSVQDTTPSLTSGWSPGVKPGSRALSQRWMSV